MHIRPERPEDAPAIAALVERAFASAPHSNGREQFIVSALRSAGALTVSMVVEQAGQLVGHVAFSPVAKGQSVPGLGYAGFAHRTHRASCSRYVHAVI